MGYDFQVEYTKGSENVSVYTLSHHYETKPIEGSLLALTKLLPHWLEATKDEVATKPTFQLLYSRIQYREAIGP